MIIIDEEVAKNRIAKRIANFMITDTRELATANH